MASNTPTSSRPRKQKSRDNQTPNPPVNLFDPSVTPYVPRLDGPIYSPNNAHMSGFYPFASQQQYVGFSPQNPSQNQPQQLHNPFAPIPMRQPQFGGFSPQPQPQPQQPNEPDEDFMVDFDAEETVPETVPETQEETVPVATRNAKAKKKPWSAEEEEHLCDAWLEVTEDAVISNNRKRSTFWKDILDSFHRRMKKTPYRTVDQVNSKWRHIAKSLSSWHGLLSSLQRKKQSGANAEIILQTAHRHYLREQGKPFPYSHCWERLKDAQKWKDVLTIDESQSGSSKRSRTSVDAPAENFEDYEVELDFDLNDDVEEVERPIGRDRAKKGKSVSGASSQSSENAALLKTTLDEFNTKIGGLMEKHIELKEQHYEERKQERLLRQQEYFEAKAEREAAKKEKQFERDLAFLEKPVENLPPSVREMVLAKKRDIAAKYNITL